MNDIQSTCNKPTADEQDRLCRRVGIAAVAFLGGVLWICRAVSADRANNRELPLPSGLVVVRAVLNTPKMDQEFLQHAISNPSISGVAYQVKWKDLEPTEGHPDWSQLDAVFAAAESSKKWVQLLIFPGFHTPSWALQDVKADSFPMQYTQEKGTILPLPMPWDKVYLDRWFTFLKLVNDRYGKSPSFVMIAADGPTSVSAEMTLPDKPADLITWRNDGYMSQKYIDAYQAVFQNYAEIFPNQFISLSVGTGLNINNRGLADRKEGKRTRQMIIDQATALLGRRFVLQNSDLHAGPEQLPATAFVRELSGKMTTGLQMRCDAERGGSAIMGADGDAPLALRRSIDLGMTPSPSGQHVNYIEIYTADVVADEMQPVLQYGASLFSK